MRARLSFQAIAIALLLLLIVSPIMAVCGQVAGQVSPDNPSKELERLRLRAYALQRVLGWVANVTNISDSLKGEVKALISMNISALSEKELRDFISEAEALLAEIRESIPRYNVTLSQGRVALRFLERVRERLIEVNASERVSRR
jgi:hypothetical protein